MIQDNNPVIIAANVGDNAAVIVGNDNDAGDNAAVIVGDDDNAGYIAAVIVGNDNDAGYIADDGNDDYAVLSGDAIQELSIIH